VYFCRAEAPPTEESGTIAFPHHAISDLDFVKQKFPAAKWSAAFAFAKMPASIRRSQIAVEGIVLKTCIDNISFKEDAPRYPKTAGRRDRRSQWSSGDSVPLALRTRCGASAGRLRSIPGRSLNMTDATKNPNVDKVDVRSLVPAQRHAKIFELVNKLTPGGSFILVNDHDPKPLYYQLEAEYPKQFSWVYVERGPEVWQVEIGKLAKAA
jgi:uncharacterized protein (DUF2249 family)